MYYHLTQSLAFILCASNLPTLLGSTCHLKSSNRVCKLFSDENNSKGRGFGQDLSRWQGRCACATRSVSRGSGRRVPGNHGSVRLWQIYHAASVRRLADPHKWSDCS